MKHETAIKLIELEIENLEKAVKVINEIKKIVPKFDGKTPSKRIDTALKAIDKNLRFETRYNSFVIELYKEIRHVQDTPQTVVYSNSHSTFILHASIKSSYGDGVCQNDTIDGKIFLAELETSQEHKKAFIVKLRAELGNLDNIIVNHARIKKEKELFLSGVSSLTREYFDLKL